MEEEHRLIWESVPPESMVSLTVGRAMTALLSARPRKLHDAVSRLSSDPKRGSLGTSISLSHTHADFHLQSYLLYWSLKLVFFTLTPNFAGSLEDSLWFLHKYVNDADEDEEALDQILVPMIEHVIRFYCPFSYFKHGVYLYLFIY